CVTVFAFVRSEPCRSADTDAGVIHLFNGKDLTNFYTYLAAPQGSKQRYGKNNDPEKVFTVHDGMVHVSGTVSGGFITEKEYENYHLIVEYKWGEKTWSPREDKARDSGILLHCVGEDGAARPWMESIECQMIEGGTGDIILVAAKGKPSVSVEAEKRGDQTYYKPGAPAMTVQKARINWYG